MAENNCATQDVPAENSGNNCNPKPFPSVEERILFQPDTVLDRQAVSVELLTLVKVP